MKKKYLLCPQCGLHRFFIENEKSENIYFHVGWDRKPFPTDASNADLSQIDFSRFKCTGCSWTGNVKGLVKYIR